MKHFLIFVIKFAMKKGDKLICLETINGPLDQILFEKKKIYHVSYIDNEKSIIMVCINGGLYPLNWVNKKFKLV